LNTNVKKASGKSII